MNRTGHGNLIAPAVARRVDSIYFAAVLVVDTMSYGLNEPLPEEDHDTAKYTHLCSLCVELALVRDFRRKNADGDVIPVLRFIINRFLTSAVHLRHAVGLESSHHATDVIRNSVEICYTCDINGVIGHLLLRNGNRYVVSLHAHH